MGTGLQAAGRTRTLMALWVTAVGVAWVGQRILFDSSPGLGWGLWTALASGGLVAFTHGTRGRPGKTLLTLLALACILAFGATFTAAESAFALIFLSVTMLLSIAMLLAPDDGPGRLTVWLAILAPPVAAARALYETALRMGEAAQLLGDRKSVPLVRGALLTLPVVIAFALLLAGADPTFAGWRDSIAAALSSWVIVPRLVFFALLLVMTLGAFSFAVRNAPLPRPTLAGVLPAGAAPVLRIGGTERAMLLGSVAALFAVFLALQVSYFFGNAPAIAGSGVTYAEFARRGFGELSLVATGCTALMVLLDLLAARGARERIIRGVQLVLVGEMLLLLMSAFRRVSLYEAAYGFTTARLYAQAYMVVMAVVLGVLTLEILRGLDVNRLVMRSVFAGTLAFTGLTYWNHEGWIATKNIDRLRATGRVDLRYLTQQLSPNATPAIVRALPSLPPAPAAMIRECLTSRYAGWGSGDRDEWYEWNLARARARRALAKAGIPSSSARSQYSHTSRALCQAGQRSFS
ncbi:MAG: DUF4173 domain-containing protein [Gemmatimonadaceae bacterium]